MSTGISNTKNHSLTQIGEKAGLFLQITPLSELKLPPGPIRPIDMLQISTFIQIDAYEAYELIQELTKWIKQLTEYQADQISKQLDDLELTKKTILHEAAECQRFIDDLQHLDIPMRLLGN